MKLYCTGMRYKELQLFADHPEWFHYNRTIIIIPKKDTKTRDERKVNLTPQFSELLYYFLHGGHRLKYSVYQSWSANLRRWAALAGIEHPEDLSAGSTRKAWESWLIESVELCFSPQLYEFIIINHFIRMHTNQNL